MPQPTLISVVDDDEFFRDSMRRLLKSHGFAVAVFASAAEFLASACLPATACLVADIHMPVMTGTELYVHLIKTGRRIPTILITAYPEEDAQEHMLRMGIGCYLPKPLDETALIDCLRTAFARSHGVSG